MGISLQSGCLVRSFVHIELLEWVCTNCTAITWAHLKALMWELRQLLLLLKCILFWVNPRDVFQPLFGLRQLFFRLVKNASTATEQNCASTTKERSEA